MREWRPLGNRRKTRVEKWPPSLGLALEPVCPEPLNLQPTLISL